MQNLLHTITDSKICNHFIFSLNITDMIVACRSATSAIVHITNAAVLFHLIVLLDAAGAGGGGGSSGTNTMTTSSKLSATQCAMSEFTCTNGKCIQLNKYCDNANDCGDSSDEPRFCTRKYDYTSSALMFNLILCT